MSNINYGPDFGAKIDEIVRLVGEGSEHLIHLDGHCKSSEGAVEVSIPPFSWREESVTPSVGVYSYLMGPSRMHYFDTVDEALATVRDWHAEAMAVTEDDYA